MKFLWMIRLGPKNSNWVSNAMLFLLLWAHLGTNTNFTIDFALKSEIQKSSSYNFCSLALEICVLDLFNETRTMPWESLLTPWTKDVLDNDLETSSALCTKNALRLYLTRILQNLNLAKWPFLGSHLGHVEVMWPAQGCFLT